MKYFIGLFILPFAISTTDAQIIEAPNNRGMIDNILSVKPQSIKGNFQPAKFLFNTDKGKVYALPQDNMPCLVPHINSNMPIARLNIIPYKPIPNALPEQKVIPKEENLIFPLEKK